MEARALAAEAATVPEHVLLSPQSQEPAPTAAPEGRRAWKEDVDRIEASLPENDLAYRYDADGKITSEVNVDGTFVLAAS